MVWAMPGNEAHLKDLAAEYSGKTTVMSIDMDQSPKLTTYFEIGYIPDTS